MITHEDYTTEYIKSQMEIQQSHYELNQWLNQYMDKVETAGFGDDSEAYEASWNRTFNYAQSGAIDDLLENNA